MEIKIKATDLDIFKEMATLLTGYFNASKKFINKVESGKAKSLETYSDLKQLYNETKEFLDNHNIKISNNNIKILYLEDLADYTYEELVEHVIRDYEANREDVEKFDFLIAYESVGSWGCDSSSFFLLREKETGKLFENHGSHCSCYGFEGQWTPEETTVEYLQSDKFYFYCGGYDNSEEFNRNSVMEYTKSL